MLPPLDRMQASSQRLYEHVGRLKFICWTWFALAVGKLLKDIFYGLHGLSSFYCGEVSVGPGE